MFRQTSDVFLIHWNIAYDDWTVSQLAEALGKEEDAKLFAERGSWWKNAINPETGYAQMRNSDGSWSKDFDPFHFRCEPSLCGGKCLAIDLFLFPKMFRLWRK